MDDVKRKALDEALLKIEKDYGRGSVMKLGDSEISRNIETISTGSMALDMALGIGGIPKGRIVEIYGPESSGKTTVTLHMIAETQKAGGIAAFIDAEHALDPAYARNIGVDTDNLYVSQPDSGEQALRKLTGVVSKTHCTVVFINQLREKIGIPFGNPETTTGGRALKFYSSVRLDIRKTETLKKSGEPIGNHAKVKVVKNKVAPPFREAQFDILFGVGIDKTGEIIDIAGSMGIISKTGSWFAYNGGRWQGRDGLKKALSEKPEIIETLRKKVIERFEKQSEKH